MSEYRYGNTEKWLDLVAQAWEINPFDAEIILDLIEIYLLEKQPLKAKRCSDTTTSMQQKSKHLTKPRSTTITKWKSLVNIFKADIPSISDNLCLFLTVLYLFHFLWIVSVSVSLHRSSASASILCLMSMLLHLDLRQSLLIILSTRTLYPNSKKMYKKRSLILQSWV